MPTFVFPSSKILGRYKISPARESSARPNRLLRYYYINKEWMLSRVAQRVYRLSASLSGALFFMIVVMPGAGDIPLAIRLLAKSLLFLGVLGAAITTVAMEYFLFGFDDSPAMKKVFWFCVMLLPYFGPALYCFLVYSRSAVLQKNHVKRAGTASA